MESLRLTNIEVPSLRALADGFSDGVSNISHLDLSHVTGIETPWLENLFLTLADDGHRMSQKMVSLLIVATDGDINHRTIIQAALRMMSTNRVLESLGLHLKCQENFSAEYRAMRTALAPHNGVKLGKYSHHMVAMLSAIRTRPEQCFQRIGSDICNAIFGFAGFYVRRYVQFSLTGADGDEQVGDEADEDNENGERHQDDTALDSNDGDREDHDADE